MKSGSIVTGIAACTGIFSFADAFLPFNGPQHFHNAFLTRVAMSKDPDRARIEKDLEDMMGNDWRVFRAKLVAQERVEHLERGQENGGQKSSASGAGHSQLPNFLSSFFGPKDGSDRPPVVDNANDQRRGRGKQVYIGGSSVPVEDPFASEDELPMMIQPKVTLDKHRWAHSIGHIEPGCVLIANEKLGGVFHQTVVLIIDHHEQTGSTGIVINRPMPGNLLKVASETSGNVDLSIKLAFNNAAVSYGGPVMQDEYTCLHGYGEVEGAKKVCPGVFVGGSKELLNEVRQNKFDPQQCLFVKGHAAWVPQQLQREISKGVWYTAAVSDDFLLRYAGAPGAHVDENDLWADILTCMDGNYADIALRYQGRGDKRITP